MALGPVREALAVGRKRRQPVLDGVGGTLSGRFSGTRRGIVVLDQYDTIVAPHAHRGSLARDAFRLRAFRVAIVDVRVGADESDRAGRGRSSTDNRYGEEQNACGGCEDKQPCTY